MAAVAEQEKQGRFANVAPGPDTPMLPTLRSREINALEPQTIGEMWELAQAFCRAVVVPESYRGKPADVFYAMQFGRELGLSLVQSVQNVAVIGGRASIYGDAFLAIVRQRAGSQMTKFEETWDEKKDGGTWTTRVQRGKETEVVRSFSVGDAGKIEIYANGKTIRLIDKGTWRAYPRRMCKFKARNEALRDAFPDILLGLYAREEADEIIDAEIVATSSTAAAEPSVDEVIASLLAPLDDATATALGQGFEALSMSKGQRLSKLRAYQGRESELADWMRDEYTKRKSHGAKGEAVRKAGPRPVEQVAETKAVEIKGEVVTVREQTGEIVDVSPGDTIEALAVGDVFDGPVL